MGDESVYIKWWKQLDKYKVFGVTIHEIKEAMDICDNKPFDQSEEKFSRLEELDNKPFDQSEEKFSRLEELLNVSFNIFEVTLLPEYDNNSKVRYKQFASSQIYSGHKSTNLLSLCILNHARDTNTFPNHFIYIKDLT